MDPTPRYTGESDLCVTRRRFLRTAAVLAGGSCLPSGPATGNPSVGRVAAFAEDARVVRIGSHYVVDGPQVHGPVLREMFEEALKALAGEPSPEKAWRRFLHPNDVIGLKFNQSGQQLIATSRQVAETLIGSLLGAGWSADQLVCIEAPPRIASKFRTRPAIDGYSRSVTDFGSGSDQLAAVLDQVTAMINIPFLKTHQIAGMSCGLKNLSHGLIKHPARFHSNGCSPYIADIVALPAIKDKLRLTIVDALRVVFDRGPRPTADTIHDAGTLILSADALAGDAIGLLTLNDIRQENNLEAVYRAAPDAGYLAAAAKRGLGALSQGQIELLDLSFKGDRSETVPPTP